MRQRRSGRKWCELIASILAISAVVAVAAASPIGAAETFAVTTTNDTVDDDLDDPACLDAAGECSLRAAVMQANKTPGADTITVPAGTYALTLPSPDPAGPDAWSVISTSRTSLTITGAGRDSTVVAGGAGWSDRLLEVDFGSDAGNLDFSLQASPDEREVRRPRRRPLLHRCRRNAVAERDEVRRQYRRHLCRRQRGWNLRPREATSPWTPSCSRGTRPAGRAAVCTSTHRRVRAQPAPTASRLSGITPATTAGPRDDRPGGFRRHGPQARDNAAGESSNGKGGGLSLQFTDAALSGRNDSGNRSTSDGGGISTDAPLLITGGVIRANTTGNGGVHGGGISFTARGAGLSLTDLAIEGNKSNDGGGLWSDAGPSQPSGYRSRATR